MKISFELTLNAVETLAIQAFEVKWGTTIAALAQEAAKDAVKRAVHELDAGLREKLQRLYPNATPEQKIALITALESIDGDS